MRTIVQNGESMTLYDNGDVARPSLPAPYNTASGKWKITGAVTLNNLGGVTRRWTLAEILADPSAIPWQHGNGRQRTHLTDLDHGTARMWSGGPDAYHYVR
jgi:hypothetical protein